LSLEKCGVVTGYFSDRKSRPTATLIRKIIFTALGMLRKFYYHIWIDFLGSKWIFDILKFISNSCCLMCKKSGKKLLQEVKNFDFETWRYQLHTEQKLFVIAQIFVKIDRNVILAKKRVFRQNSRNGQRKALRCECASLQIISRAWMFCNRIEQAKK